MFSKHFSMLLPSLMSLEQQMLETSLSSWSAVCGFTALPTQTLYGVSYPFLTAKEARIHGYRTSRLSDSSV
ncbi:hypothetical protein C0Q70_17680 [Pomacea canaliculata]|uniref:Uncharacterized protein n=1 Tax=Pomacea canaliculata TaxID=400727 RepID=A0A2T7NL23_POMCA|nr:hypothetical protein C0Q70_17680 [Pomacea canaliculata]